MSLKKKQNESKKNNRSVCFFSVIERSKTKRDCLLKHFMTACNADVNILADFDVHHIRPSNTFVLHASNVLSACNQQSSALPFCLLPPSTRLANMCREKTWEPYFHSILNGMVTKLEDLPIVWDVILDSPSDPEWISLSVSNQRYLDGLYLGLQPLPLFSKIALSSSFRDLWGVKDGRLFRTRDTGFVERESSMVFGANNAFQTVVLNSSGSMGVVMFQDALFFWQEGAFTNSTVSNNAYHDVKLFTTSQDTDTHIIVTASQGAGGTTCSVRHYKGASVFTLVRESTFLLNGKALLWVALTSDAQQTLVCVNAPNKDQVFVVSNAADGIFPALLWNVPKLFGASVFSGPWTTICRSGPTLLQIVAWNALSRILFFFALTASVPDGLASVLDTQVNSLDEPLSRAVFAYAKDHTIHVCVGNNASAIQVPILTGLPSTASVSKLVFFPDGTKTFAFLDNHQMFTNSNNSPSQLFGTSFVFENDLFTNEDTHVSDYGLLDSSLPKPEATWFFGYRVAPLIKAGDVIVSPHQYYRFVIDSSPTISLPGTTFARIGATLQRANLNALFRGSSGTTTLQLSNTSNLMLKTNNDTLIVWERNTTDSYSDPTQVVSINALALLDDNNNTPPSAFQSSNGLYICFRRRESNELRLAFNVFNAAAFADFCDEVPERKARAIMHQANFCWTALWREDTRTFVDKRCTCIGGPRMLDIAFPNRVFSNMTRARLEHNLPCLLGSCQESLATPEVTNVYNLVAKQCLDQSLTLCSSLIVNNNASGSFQLGQGIVSQNCGSNLLSCGQDSQCPIGTTCVNGTCVANCTTNEECGVGSTCQQGICISPQSVPSSTTSNTKKASQLILIVLGILMALLLLSLLLVLLIKRH